MLICLKHIYNVAHFPKLLRNASGHSRRRAQRLVNANKVLIHEMQRHGVRVVLHFLGERSRKARHADFGDDSDGAGHAAGGSLLAGKSGWRCQLTDLRKFSDTVAISPPTTSECSLSKTIRDVFSSTLTT